MARLERIVLVKMPDYDERMIEGLIELREKHGMKGRVLKYVASLFDRTVDETQPLYSLSDDEDMLIWPQYIADTTVDLGSHHIEEAAIARCQEHHDGIHGKNY